MERMGLMRRAQYGVAWRRFLAPSPSVLRLVLQLRTHQDAKFFLRVSAVTSRLIEGRSLPVGLGNRNAEDASALVRSKQPRN